MWRIEKGVKDIIPWKFKFPKETKPTPVGEEPRERDWITNASETWQELTGSNDTESFNK